MTQANFSDSEWSTLTEAPMHVVKAIVLADKSDPVSFLKEAKAAMHILAEEQGRKNVSSDIVQSVLNALNAQDGGETMTGERLELKKEFEFLGALQTLKNSDEGKKQAIDQLQKIGPLLASKVTAAEGQEVKDWLLSIAHKVAGAVREEGGLFGGGLVSSQESAVINQIEKAISFSS